LFTKFLKSLKGSQRENSNKLLDKISKMDLVEMRIYINEKLDDFEVDDFGLHEVVKKLINMNEQSSKYFLQENDLDSKKKKAFELLLLILQHKKTSIAVIESTQEFLDVYDKLIKQYDKDNKDIYESKIKKLMSLAVDRINKQTNIINVMEVSK